VATQTPDPSAVLRKGHDLFFADPPDYRAAMECFRQVTELAPDWAEGHQCLASAYDQLWDEKRAAEEYQIAHRLAPTDSRALIALGLLRTKQRRYKEAVRLLEAGVALKPHYCYADAKLFLAEAYVGARKIKKAIEQWQDVLKLEPMYPSFDAPMQEAQRKLQEHGVTGK
jgi:tetratricopeptide (TPR) repeat protein